MEDLAPLTLYAFVSEHPAAAGGRTDRDGAQAEPARRGAEPGLPDTRDRLERGLPSGEVGTERSDDFVVPSRRRPWFYRGATPVIRNLG